MVKETSVRAQQNHYRLSPMTPEKRAYLDREAYMDQITRPDRFPQYVEYTEEQLPLMLFAIGEGRFKGYVNPFSEADYQELLLDVAFWIQEALYVHYWEAEPSLTWTDFLELTQDREDIEAAAQQVLRYFEKFCSPTEDVFEWWDVLGSVKRAGSYDYASRKDLIPEDGPTPPLLVPMDELKAAVDSMIHLMESSLFVRKRMKHRGLTWEAFCAALEAEPGLIDVLAQNIRWQFSLNPHRYKELWESPLVTIPPLRIP